MLWPKKVKLQVFFLLSYTINGVCYLIYIYSKYANLVLGCLWLFNVTLQLYLLELSHYFLQPEEIASLKNFILIICTNGLWCLHSINPDLLCDF